MDVSLAESIYERAQKALRNNSREDAEAAIQGYCELRRNNSNLPYVKKFQGLVDGTGRLFKEISYTGEEKLKTIIKSLKPFIPDSNDKDFFIKKVPEDIGCSKGPVTIKIPRNQEPIHYMEKHISEKNDSHELSHFLDTILEKANFKETEWIEFKNIFLNKIEYLGIIFSSLANSACLKNVKHAYLIYGVNELKKEISGTNFSTDSKAWQIIEQELFRNFVPKLNYKILEFNYNENPKQHIVIFEIQAANTKPIAYCGKAFIRQDDRPIALEDFPNLLKILSNPKQQPIIDNSIHFIIKKPQFFFMPPLQKTTDDTDNKSKKLDIKWIITMIVAIIAIPFSGFAVKSCGEDKDNVNKASKSINVQDNSSNQSSLKIISGDNSNININVGKKISSTPTSNETTENNINTKDTLHKLSAMINNANEDLNRDNSTDSFIINQQYLITAKNIFKLANNIIPNDAKSSGLLEGLINRYNAFAKRAKLDLVKEYDSVYDRDYSMDRIAAPGIAKLNEIILNLRTYIDIAEIEIRKK